MSDWLSPLISGVGSVIGNSINAINQANINQKNLDYAKSMTQAQWERDDTQYQRQIADAEAAGLSPLSVLGQSYGNSNALSATQQAPQIDLNGLIQGAQMLNNNFQNKKDREMQNEQFTKQLNEDIEHNKIMENQGARAISQKYDELENQALKLDYDYQLARAKIESDISSHQKQLEIDQLNEIAKKYPGQVKYYSKFEDYSDALSEYNEAYQEQISTLREQYQSGTFYSNGDSHSSSGGFSLGAGAKVVGTGGDGQIGINGSGSDSESYSRDFSQIFEQEMNSWFLTHPFPVYTGSIKNISKYSNPFDSYAHKVGEGLKDKQDITETIIIPTTRGEKNLRR